MEPSFCDTLAAALEKVIWHTPSTQLEAADPMFRSIAAAADCPIAALLARLADETLAIAVQKNFLRKQTFEELLVHRHEERLLHWIFRHTGNWEQAQDLTQELYLKLLLKNTLAAYNPDYPFEPWLWTVVRNLCVGEWRRNRRHVSGVSPLWEDQGLLPPEDATFRELQERLEVAVRELPPLQQQIFREAMNGANAAHMARELAVPKDKVFQQLFKARRQIERALGLEPGAGTRRKGTQSTPRLPSERISP